MDITKRLQNRAAVLNMEGLYVESAMNEEAAETIRILRDEVQRLESLTGMLEPRQIHPLKKKPQTCPPFKIGRVTV